MRLTLLLCIFLLGCRKDCPEPVICGTVIGQAQSIFTGASYAIVGPSPYRYIIIPWDQYPVQTGQYLCGVEGTHDPHDPGNPFYTP